MPANLPPQYYAAEKRYRFARTYQEKIAILKEMLAIMPKHKGTEKLQGDLRARISRLNKEAQKKHARRGFTYHIRKEGAAQIVLVGTPNTGKSQLVASLTNAAPEVAPYPFTTRKPVVGMMPFEDIKMQLVDTPSITDDFMEPWLLDIVRNADLVLLVVDLADDNVLEQIETISGRLEQSKIRLVGREPEGGLVDEYLYKKTMIVGNKNDAQKAGERFEILRDLYAEKFPVASISAKEANELEDLKREVYKVLDIVRVYTKEPRKLADRSEPVILRRGSTVIDAAVSIHKEFASRLKYARLWGSNRFDGQRVERNYVVEDRDIVEFHL